MFAQMDVTVAGVDGTDAVVCSRNIVIKPDMKLSEAVKKDFDVVVCPGGMKGSENLSSVKILQVYL